MEFCKQFNAVTQSRLGEVTPVELTVFSDRSFTFITKTPPASYLLMKAAGIEKGSAEPNKNKIARLPKEKVMEIAKQKMNDLNAASEEAAFKIIAGTARSMGIQVSE